MKNLFVSKTFWAIVTGVIAAITPAALEYGRTGYITREQAVSAIIATLSGLAAIGGRYAAKEVVYTPHGLPGRDKEDIGPDGMLQWFRVPINSKVKKGYMGLITPIHSLAAPVVGPPGAFY